MASVPSPSPPPPRSASDSANTNQLEAATDNGVSHVEDKKPDFTDGLDHLESAQCIERFRKYDDDYAHRLMAKYFSAKSFYGGNIFDVQMAVDEEIIKSSKSFADPVVGFEEQCSNGSPPPADSPANLPNGKPAVKKN
ncbi:hypothetical protein CR513_60886, partial [Mucuna pruriens]